MPQRLRRRVAAATCAVGVLTVVVGVGCTAGPEAGGGALAPTTQEISPRGQTDSGWVVASVVDGDTVRVRKGGSELAVRLIGIDTPEVAGPYTQVECFGPAATRYAVQVLAGREVRLEFDPTQGRRDRYDRTLAYLWVEAEGGPWLYNLEAVARGFATEYTYDTRYAWQAELRAAERDAERAGRGLWSACR